MAELMQLVNGHVTMNAVLEVSVRRIRAEESDHIKGFAAEGYTLKAQVSVDEQRVYIEQKNEDGSYQAYEVNPLLISKDTDNPIEQMAAEAWEKATKRINAGMGSEHDAEDGGESFTFEKMLEEFQSFVEKRIKEGPPKIPTGGAEFSEEEWERMLEKIDEIIDEFKEELGRGYKNRTTKCRPNRRRIRTLPNQGEAVFWRGWREPIGRRILIWRMNRDRSCITALPFTATIKNSRFA